MTAGTSVFPLDIATDWYRQPSVKVAFVLSLLVHGIAITLLPGLRVPKPVEPAPIIVELARTPVIAAPVPMPVVVPEPQPVVQSPPPVPKKELEPPPPPPVIREEPKPQPPKPELQPVPPPETRVPQRPEPIPQPSPEPRVEAPPPVVAQPPIEPQAEPREEPPPSPRVQAPAQALPQSPPFDPNAAKAYGSVLADAIGKRKRYPRIAQLRGWHGTTELRLLFGADGKLKDLTVARSSGFEVLDQHAITMVKESVPLPDVPESLRGQEFPILVPVAFKLQ